MSCQVRVILLGMNKSKDHGIIRRRLDIEEKSKVIVHGAPHAAVLYLLVTICCMRICRHTHHDRRRT